MLSRKTISLLRSLVGSIRPEQQRRIGKPQPKTIKKIYLTALLLNNKLTLQSKTQKTAPFSRSGTKAG